MRKLGSVITVLLCALLVVGQTPAPQRPPLKVNIGDMAPDFTLKVWDGAKLSDISLADFRGKQNVILAFFVFAFTGG